MFTIIGGDGQEYGPASAEQVRAWIAAGRANLDTKARAAGSDEWRRLGDYAEFFAPESAPPIIDLERNEASLAGLGARFGARLLDWIVEIIFTLPGLLVLGPQFFQLMSDAMQGEEPDFESLDMAQFGLGGLLFVGGWLLLLVIQVTLLSTRGQSLGKFVTRVRVVRVDESKAGFVHAWLTREALVTLIGVVLGVLPFIGILLRAAFHITDWCFIFRQDRRCLHDLIAGTKVVKA